MDPFHARLVRVGLGAAESFGFCLAGGYAVQAHGFVIRRSDDVDLFTTMAAERDFPAAVEAVVSALDAEGLDVTIEQNAPTFARLIVADAQAKEAARLELGVDWRANAPVRLEVGPVLHPDDAVANKVCALYGRGAVRDYIDVDGILRSGRYPLEKILRLAADHDPGFEPTMFAQAMAAVDRLPDEAFEPYDLGPAEAAALRERIGEWSRQVS
jgi:hypothetical protein